MWAAILNDENEFQNVVKHISKSLLIDFEKNQTATGTMVARCNLNSSIPVFVFTPANSESIQNSLLWLQHNIHPQVFVATGLIRCCSKDFQEKPFHVPDVCIRTAGRVDFGGIPILFEEYSFDSQTQNFIKESLSLDMEFKQKTFGPSKDIASPNNREWLFQNFGTDGTDPTIGQFAKIVRSLGIPSACLKIFSEAPQPLDKLCQAWEKICRKKMESGKRS